MKRPWPPCKKYEGNKLCPKHELGCREDCNAFAEFRSDIEAYNALVYSNRNNNRDVLGYFNDHKTQIMKYAKKHYIKRGGNYDKYR